MSSHALVLVLLALVGVALSLAMPQRAQASMASLFSAEAGALSPLAEPTEPPDVEPKPATNLTQTSATLNGTVNPMGGEVTKCELEYGTTTLYGSTAPCTPMPGSGSVPVAVSRSVTGLTLNTAYHFRVSATNSLGTSWSADATFKTLPVAPSAAIEAPSAVTQTSASLNGTVNPNGSAVTKCEFEYGETIAYGKSAACTSLPGSGSSPVAVTAAVTALKLNTKYYLRLAATGPGGTARSQTELLRTLPNPPEVVTGAASSITQTTATLNGTVNPSGSEVTECKVEYGTTSAYGSSVPCTSLPGAGSSPMPVSAPIVGLSPGISYHFTVSATNAGGTTRGSDATFKTIPPPAPAVVTAAASSITQTTATLNGTVNPNGGEVSGCKVEYGTTDSYGSSAQCTSLPGSGSSPVPVSAPVSGLSPATTYHFRFSATNAGGIREGLDVTFKTTLLPPPTVLTAAASSIGQTSATLNATVNPMGTAVARCELEYGTTTAYGSSAPCSSLPGSGSSAVPVSAPVTGLVPSTTYHFRISATNAGGPSEGSDETFTTLAVPPSGPSPGGGPPVGPGPGVTAGLPAPVLAKSANLSRVVGQVRVRLPGTRPFLTLSTPRQVPYGTVVEAIHGEVSVTAATPSGGIQRGQFFDGQFVLTQGRNGRVLATLTGGKFNVCQRAKPARAGSKSAPRTHLVRRLWAEGHGNFSTKGRYAGGIVQGAQWLTEDMCQGTLILATREHVEVTDLVRHRHIQVLTGGIYLAKRH